MFFVNFKIWNFLIKFYFFYFFGLNLRIVQSYQFVTSRRLPRSNVPPFKSYDNLNTGLLNRVKKGEILMMNEEIRWNIRLLLLKKTVSAGSGSGSYDSSGTLATSVIRPCIFVWLLRRRSYKMSINLLILIETSRAKSIKVSRKHFSSRDKRNNGFRDFNQSSNAALPIDSSKGQGMHFIDGIFVEQFVYFLMEAFCMRNMWGMIPDSAVFSAIPDASLMHKIYDYGESGPILLS